jgi:hypothetical protein
MGDARLKLQQTDDKYALLLVDAFSSDAIPVHLLTVEAVKLYLERMTPDGILAIHISNKYVKLEPVVAKIAQDLNLVGRMWSDDSEGYSGKTGSSWIVLARDKKDLGAMGEDASAQAVAFGVKNQELNRLLAEKPPETPGPLAAILPGAAYYHYEVNNYGPSAEAKNVLTRVYGNDVLEFWAESKQVIDELKKLRQDVKNPREENNPLQVRPEVKAKELELKLTDAQRKFSRKRGRQAFQLADYVRREMDDRPTLRSLVFTQAGYGMLFHPIQVLPGVDLWTDDYADVMRVMMIPELQQIRKWAGLPTPVGLKKSDE